MWVKKGKEDMFVLQFGRPSVQYEGYNRCTCVRRECIGQVKLNDRW